MPHPLDLSSIARAKRRLQRQQHVRNVATWMVMGGIGVACWMAIWALVAWALW